MPSKIHTLYIVYTFLKLIFDHKVVSDRQLHQGSVWMTGDEVAFHAVLKLTGFLLGNTKGRRMPKSRPQAAPMSSEGMKTPADTVRPYVQHARRK